jgi:hypothetical protein
MQNRSIIAHIILTVCLLSALSGNSSALAVEQGEFDRPASWTIPDFESIRQSVRELALASIESAADQPNTVPSGLDALLLEKIDTFWADDSLAADQLLVLRQYVETLPMIYPETSQIAEQILVEQIDQRDVDLSLLDSDLLPQSVRDNLRLGLARSLARSSLFDIALAQTEQLSVDSVVDPATLLFTQAICQHHLLKKDACLKTVARLMENESLLPARYREIGRLVAADIEPLEADSLDEIARMMKDIRRRQSLSHSGQKVIQEEDEVLKKLDKMIEDLEKQAQQMAMQQQQSSSPQSAKPMEDSMPGGGVGAGNVDDRTQIDGGDWGDLPPRQREAAMADLVKDLPPHYRQVIEAYFKKIARDDR